MNILRPILEDDLDQMFVWRNSRVIMARTRQSRILSWKEHIAWYNNLDMNKDLMYAIEKGGMFVGVCGITNIDYINRSGELSIYVGDESNYRKGIATKALEELKNIFFNDLNLYRFWAEVYSFNTLMICFLEANGFENEAFLKKTVFKNGQYCDSYYFSCFDLEKS